MKTKKQKKELQANYSEKIEGEDSKIITENFFIWHTRELLHRFRKSKFKIKHEN
jgi:hypothetical protein